MTPKQMQRLQNLLPDVRTTDDLLDLELRLGPFDEEDAIAAHALFLIAATRCRLAFGPAPAWEQFSLASTAPPSSRQRIEVRGRIGTRIARVVWADGGLFGSHYALRRLDRTDDRCADPDAARQRIHAVFDEVLEEVRALAVA